MRLGVYLDDVYHVDADGRISTDRAFLLFVLEAASHFDTLVLFGRRVLTADAADYMLPPEVKLIGLPHYARLSDARAVATAIPGTLRAMWRGLTVVDVVWVFGPQPLALALVLFASLRRRTVILGVRQDTVSYFTVRAGDRASRMTRAAIAVTDWSFRALSRHMEITVVGNTLATQFPHGRSVFPFTVNLVRTGELASSDSRRNQAEPISLMTVGRIDREKNPLLLVEALSRLDRRHPGRFHLIWFGRGPLVEELHDRSRALGVAHLIAVREYVPFGTELLNTYRTADIFVHVALTEGVPQVLLEAMSCGTPLVATAVGGVPEATGFGEAALLVPPADVEALVTAIESVSQSPELRRRLVESGLKIASRSTLDQEARRVASYLYSATRRRRRGSVVR